MAKNYSQEQIDAWRKQVGFRTTSSVIEEERKAREGINSKQITMAEAEQLADGSGAGGSSVEDRQLRVLEQIERNTRNNGRIG